MMGQSSNQELPEFQLKKATFESHLRYLASDALEGRYTGSEGGQKAANFIAELFKVYGVAPAGEKGGYFQTIPFDKLSPPQKSTIKLGDTTYDVNDNMVVLRGEATEINAKAVFAGHGWIDEETGHNDFQDLDVKGKLIFVLPGTPSNNDPFSVFKAMSSKRKFALEHGAIGVVELFRLNFPWKFFKNYFGKERMEVAENTANGADKLFYAVVQEGKPNPVKELEDGKVLDVFVYNSGMMKSQVSAANVAGVLEGTDPELKDEYLIVSAHYDHVGVGSQGGGAITPQDSIFNGSRDNAMGTVAMLAAVKSLVQKRPKRSVLFLAFTGEELGMVGSSYYTEHPLIPLNKSVFNLNNDGGGYNTVEQFSVIGFQRTNVQAELELAASAFGMTISKDPAPEQNLYDRSDNVSFAIKGIPAIDFAPGVTTMDESIMRYYHQVTDNPETIDFDYLLKFCQSFAHTTRLIADKKEKLAWTPGDPYEPKN